LLGKLLSEDDLVFGNVDGTPIDPDTLTHNFASLMLLAGIHPKIVSEALGHSSVAFTLDVYSHLVPGLQEAAGKRLDEVLEPRLMEARNVGNRP